MRHARLACLAFGSVVTLLAATACTLPVRTTAAVATATVEASPSSTRVAETPTTPPTPSPTPTPAAATPTTTQTATQATTGTAARANAAQAVTASGAGPGTGASSRAITHGDTSRRRVALTFDAGSDVGFTSDILDTLARERVTASFGLTGAWAEANPAQVKRMAIEGHHLFNHTWSHDSFTGLSTGRGPMTRAQRWDELDRTEAIIQRIAGVSTLPYFRPPYGDSDASVLADVGARGYTVTAMWAVDSAGWNGLSAPRIVERTLRLTTPGAILIFHVGSQSQDSAALPAIIKGLRDAGYEMGALPTLD